MRFSFGRWCSFEPLWAIHALQKLQRCSFEGRKNLEGDSDQFVNCDRGIFG